MYIDNIKLYAKNEKNKKTNKKSKYRQRGYTVKV